MSTLRARLEQAFRHIDGLEQSASAFADAPAWWVDAHEIAHFPEDRAIEIRLTKRLIAERRARLREDARVELRRSGSDWLIVRFASEVDLAFVEALIRDAVGAHLPAEGVPHRPPPTGADLERRQRWH